MDFLKFSSPEPVEVSPPVLNYPQEVKTSLFSNKKMMLIAGFSILVLVFLMRSKNEASPKLASEFIKASLAKIKAQDPVYYQYVLHELHATYPDTRELGGFLDSIGNIGEGFGKLLTTAADKYGQVLLNREAAKTQAFVAKEQSKAVLDEMRAKLAQQQIEAQTAYQAQDLQRQQMALLDTGRGLDSGTVIKWAPVILGVLGLAFMLFKKRTA